MSIFGQICTKITKFTPDLGMTAPGSCAYKMEDGTVCGKPTDKLKSRRHSVANALKTSSHSKVAAISLVAANRSGLQLQDKQWS